MRFSARARWRRNLSSYSSISYPMDASWRRTVDMTFLRKEPTIASIIGWLNTYFLPDITLTTSARVSISPVFRIMPSAPASRASTHSFSFNISPVKISTFTSGCSTFTLRQISTPIVVEPPKPRSRRIRSGLPVRISWINCVSSLAVPITSASGTSLRSSPSVPLSSRGTSSTIMTLKFSISVYPKKRLQSNIYRLNAVSFILL